jgi:ABC-2 type transport system ATP-binding protein
MGTQAELNRQVGEKDTLVLHIDESKNGEALVAAVRQIHGVLKADITDHAMAVIAQEAEEIMAPVITTANELGIKIRSVDIQEPNLEGVFLSLTGRALRD